jgi:transmembrane sensor
VDTNDVFAAGNSIAIEQLDRYLAGIATAEERQVTERWLETAPHKVVTDALRALPDVGIVGELRRRRREFDIERVVDRLEARRLAGEVGDRQVAARSMSSDSVAPAYGRQAAQTMWRAAMSSKQSRQRWAVAGVGLAVAVALVMRQQVASRDTSVTYATGMGQRLTVPLADGNRVILAPQTTLVVQGATASLTGQALFHIAHRDRASFVVRTGNVVTRVLGTTFDVRRYAADRTTRVIVTEGRVMTGNDRMVTLTQQQSANVTDSSVVVTPVDDTTRYPGWTRGVLVFKQTPILDVLGEVSKWYGYHFRLADSALAAERVTVTFDGTSAPQVIAVLQHVLNVSATVKGDVVVLSPRRRVNGPATRRGWRDSISTQRIERGR